MELTDDVPVYAPPCQSEIKAELDLADAFTPAYQYTWCDAGLVAISHTAATRSRPA